MAEDQIGRFRNQVKALYRRMRREQPVVPGLSATALHLLTVAELSPTAMRPGQLCEALQMSSPNVAATLRALESLGLVSRRKDPKDGRMWFVEVTKRGREIVAGQRESRHAWLRHAIEAELNDEEKRILFQAGELMRRLADAGEALPSRSNGVPKAELSRAQTA
jgi:DNA-binding MarR family transcriptional regulator